MWRKRWVVLSALLALGIAGCGGSEETRETPAAGDETAQVVADGNPATPQDGPAGAVTEFLEAMRDGNNEKTAQMLTKAARETAAALDMYIEPPGSDTAEFEIGKVEYMDQDAARVACTLSDLDENSQRRTEEVVWVLRCESEGWRIAGVAASVVEGEPLRAVNFEDRQHMAAMKEAQGGQPQAQRPQQTPEPIRR